MPLSQNSFVFNKILAALDYKLYSGKNDKKLRLNEWKNFIRGFHDFLNNKEKFKNAIKIINRSEIIKSKKNKSWFVYAVIKKNKKLDTKYKLCNIDDSSIAQDIKIKNINEVSFIRGFKRNNQIIEENINSNIQKLILLESELSEMQSQNKIMNIEKNKKKEINDNIILKINEFKKSEKNKKSEIFLKKIESISDELLKIEKKINFNKQEWKKIKIENNEKKKLIKDNKAFINHFKHLEKNKTIVKIEFSFIQNKNKIIPTYEIPINKKFDTFFLENDTKWVISDYDIGLLYIIKRWNNALRDITNGFYKSPFLLPTMNNPETPINCDINFITSKIKLNELQKKATDMIINSPFASYLQGPPGTGKTQVISAICSYYTNKNKTTLVSSATNEAINNVMERIKKDNIDPNMVYLRQTRDNLQRKKAIKFTEEYITFNIIDQMDKFYFKKNNYSNIANIFQTEFYKLLLKDGRDWFPKTIINQFSDSDYIAKNYNEIKTSRIIDFDAEIQTNDKRGWDLLINDCLMFFNRKNKCFDIIEIYRTKKIREEIIWINNLLCEINLSYQINDNIINYLDKIKNYYITDNKSFDNSLKKLNDNLTSENINFTTFDFETKNILVKNNLINIIGLTTTSRQSIKINDDEYELFTEYPINFSTIDEVSKSLTPEILSISRLSDKFLYSGDYRQLPPIYPISDDIITEFKEWLDDEDKSYLVDIQDECITHDDLSNYIHDLFSHNLFRKQIFEMKNNYITDSLQSYVSLKEQYRFTTDINELVNLVYDDDEKLILANDIRKFSHIKLGKNYENICSTQMIDNSLISPDFVTDLRKYNKNNKLISKIEINSEAFDQKISIYNSSLNYQSRINDYNAYVIIELLKNLINKNGKDIKKEIGIISMTRTQANHIKQIIILKKLEKELSHIKIDTVDNFQGREKKIIIVDLVSARGLFTGNGIDYEGKRNLNHYQKYERLNVAISRAQSKLIIVGAVENYLAQEVIIDVASAKQYGNKKIKLFLEWMNLITNKGGFARWKEW